ncbi:MAG: hypothetical protein R3335_08085 [Anaerolineales bacterium]|nr:hypothetical protein [Anaerolineales bacterium]
MDPQIIDYILVGLFGALVGTAELLSRYRDAPLRAVANLYAAGYIIINILAAMLALWLLRLFGVNFGLDPLTETSRLRWVQVLAAGFASMMIFRSSVFVLQVGDQNVSIGPSSILDVFLTVLDRQIDRRMARVRAEEVERIMKGVSFNKSREQLPVVAFALMQNLAREDQDTIVNKVLQLSTNSGLTDSARSTALGLALLDFVGGQVLEEAVDLIKDDISVSANGDARAPGAEAGREASIAAALSNALQTRAAGQPGSGQPAPTPAPDEDEGDGPAPADG